MRRSMIATVAAALATASNMAVGQDSALVLTGADFVSVCSRPNPEWIGFCHGYVQAVFDVAEQNPKTFCMPPNVSNTTIIGDVIQRILAINELQKFNASAVVYGIMASMYSCR
jgi:hypothetical protein